MPKPHDWKGKGAEFTDGKALYLSDLELATMVYNAIKAAAFRLVLKGAIVSSVSSDTSATCSDSATKLWSGPDITWDDKGCLKILDAKLTTLIETARANRQFRIDVPAEATGVVVGDGGGIGDAKVNAMCTC